MLQCFLSITFCNIAHLEIFSVCNRINNMTYSCVTTAGALDFTDFFVFSAHISNAICNALTPRYYAQGYFQMRGYRL